MALKIWFRFRTTSAGKSLVPCGMDGLAMGCLPVFDDLVAGPADEFENFMVTGLGTVPGIGNILVLARVQFVQQQIYFLFVKIRFRDGLHIIHHIGCHGIDAVEALHVLWDEPPGPPVAECNRTERGEVGKMEESFDAVLSEKLKKIRKVVAAVADGIYGDQF